MNTKHKIESSNNYGRFVDHEFQQKMSPAHLKRIMASMNQFGFLPSKPVQVYTKGGKYYIIDGHHRFYAAKSLGIPVLFVVEPESHSDAIGMENYAVKKWSMESFVKLYAGKGNPNYQTLLFYASKGIGIGHAASMLGGQSSHSGNLLKYVRAGTFTVKTTEHCDLVVRAIEELENEIPLIRKRTFVEALSVLLYVREFDLDTFIKRALVNPKAFVNCASREQALELIDDVYNFRAREKTNLSFLAKEAMRKRCKAYKS